MEGNKFVVKQEKRFNIHRLRQKSERVIILLIILANNFSYSYTHSLESKLVGVEKTLNMHNVLYLRTEKPNSDDIQSNEYANIEERYCEVPAQLLLYIIKTLIIGIFLHNKTILFTVGVYWIKHFKLVRISRAEAAVTIKILLVQYHLQSSWKKR